MRVIMENNKIDLRGNKQLFENKILWTIDDLKDFTGLQKQSIYNLVSSRKIPFRKKCSKLFFVPNEILNWIEEGEQK